MLHCIHEVVITLSLWMLHSTVTVDISSIRAAMEQCHLLFDIDGKLNVTDKPVEDLMKLCCVHIGPQLDWDPDIVAGLDVDFDYDNPDNVLEDDFVTLAEGPLPQNAEDNMDQEFE